MARRAFLLIILAYGLAIAGLVTLRGELVALAVPFVLYLLAGMWRAPEEIRLEIQRTLGSERTTPDAPVQVRLAVRNRGSSLKEVVIEDILPHKLKVQDGSNRHMMSLPTGKVFSWMYSVSGPRGYYPFSVVEIKASDPFGLLQRMRNFPLSGHLSILPPVVRIRSLPIRPRRTNVYSGTIPARLGGPGVEFFGVREYERGDPPAWINWNISARYPQKLYSNEFEQERVADVGIVLDGRLRTNVLCEGKSLFEYSIQAAASLAETFLEQGNRVGLLLYGHYLQWTFPGYGKIQRERILQALTRAEPGESLVFADLGNIPTQLFPARSQIVLVSPLVSGDYDILLQLRARGYQVMVISPDPVGFELAYLSALPEVTLAGRIVRLERAILLQKLRHTGVQVIDWDVAKPFDQVGSVALGRPLAWFRAIGR
ncbi:MAG: DUF58 domain-containing protein [Anaerolineales bacterium]|jgi:uncharacterized protein (DUF58 family)